MIEARKINESLYHKPYEVEGIKALSSSSLAGTDVNHNLSVDESQNLLADEGLKDMFEYFLSTLGEYELQQVIASIQETIKAELGEPARSQALDLLKRYIDYKIGIEELQQGFVVYDSGVNMLDKLIAQQSEIKTYRERFFDQVEYEAFFASEDIQNRFLIQQLKINSDETLTATEKQQHIEIASLELPEDIRATRQRAQQHALLSEQVRKMKADNAPVSEVYQLRENMLGSEAAAALADLDKRRAQWSQRLSSFSAERKTVLDSSLSEQDKEQSISELLAYHFDETERKRVSALVHFP